MIIQNIMDTIKEIEIKTRMLNKFYFPLWFNREMKIIVNKRLVNRTDHFLNNRKSRLVKRSKYNDNRKWLGLKI